MNILDLFILLAVAWQGVGGYFKGIKPGIIALGGILLSLALTAKFHANVAAGLTPVFLDNFSPFLERKIDLEINPVLLEELGMSSEVINYWYYEGREKGITGIEVTNSLSEESFYQVDPVLFLVIKIISFLIFFWVLKYFSFILADIILKRDEDVTPKNSWGGLVVGIAQGLLISMLYLFIFILIIPLEFPYAIIQEIYNSKLADIMLGLMSWFWDKII